MMKFLKIFFLPDFVQKLFKPASVVSSSFLNKTAWNAIASFSNMMSRLFASVFIARILGADNTGWFYYLIWISETIVTLFAAGYQETLPRYLAEFNSSRGVLRKLTAWIFKRYVLHSLAGVILALFFARFWMSPKYDKTVLLFFLPMLSTRFLSGFYQSYLTGLQRFDILARFNLISSLLLIFGVITGTYWFGVPGALLGYSLGTLFPFLFSFSLIEINRAGDELSRPVKKRFLNYAFFIWITCILNAFVWARMEVFFLHRYWADAEVSLFSIPQTVTGLILNLAAMLSGAFMPHFAALWGAKNIEKIHSIFGSGNRLMALILFPLSLGGASIMPVVFPLFYGHKFDPAIPNAMVLFAASFMNFGNIGAALISGLDRSKFFAFIAFLGAVCSLIAGFTVIRLWGSWGAVWSKSIIQIGITFACLLYVAKIIRCPVPFRDLGRLMISSVLCALSAGIIVHFLTNITGLVLALCVGAFSYLIGIKIFRGITKQDIGYLERVVNRIPIFFRPPVLALLQFITPNPSR